MNKKGMTLIEIIISIVLISIVLIFLFSLLINVKDINEESEVNSSYLITKSLVLKNIEEDIKQFSENKLIIDTCDVTDVYSDYDTTKLNGNNINFCISFKDFDEILISYLSLYYYDKKSSYVISYITENIKTTRELKDFGKNNKTDITPTVTFSSTTATDSRFMNIYVNIIGPDNKDYSLNIPYYGIITDNINTNTP